MHRPAPRTPTNDRRYVAHGGNPDRFTGPGGKPSLHLVMHRDMIGEVALRLCEDATGLLVSPSDERLPAMGIHVAQLHGEWSRRAACESGDLRPGNRVRLVREPFNDLDVNAVAVYDLSCRHLVGYLNRGQARTLARIIDGGERIDAISVRGTEAGVSCDAVTILAASPEILAHLARFLPGQ